MNTFFTLSPAQGSISFPPFLRINQFIEHIARGIINNYLNFALFYILTSYNYSTELLLQSTYSGELFPHPPRSASPVKEKSPSSHTTFPGTAAPCVSVSSGCGNEILETGWLLQQKCICLQVRRLEALSGGAGPGGPWRELSPSPADGCLLVARPLSCTGETVRSGVSSSS